MNIAELKKWVKNDNEAIIISSETNRRYFTEFPSTDGYLVITSKKALFFTDSRYIEAASLKCRGCETALLKRISDEIAEFLNKEEINRVYCERERMTVSELESLKKSIPFCRITPSVKLEKKIDSLRAVKSQDEIDAIVNAQRIAEDAFTHILDYIRPGVTEKEIGLELDYYMLSHGAEGLSFETIAVTGKKTSMPHGVPDENIVRNGDFITMDYGATVNGYHSDMTRTVAVGKVSSKQKQVYNIVLEAQRKSIEILKAGISGFDGDKAARDVIINAGYGEFFGHGTGHGVGVEIHEKPNVSPRAKQILEVGNVVTVEPGIYIPGEFGVRIEDMVLITENGCRNLTCAPKELIIL